VWQLEQQILSVLETDNPQSVRHVYYQMTNPRLPQPVEKTQRGYRHVQDRCVKLRRTGRLPYHWISDLSRRGYFVNTFDGAADFLTRMNGLYRADLWRDADVRCEVWCESRSIASVIQRDCNELAVSLYPCGGFSSISFAHEAAMEHNANDDSRPLVVLFIGDYDPAGVLIDVALEAELRRHLDDRIELIFERVAINENQIARYDLPTKPRKEGDRRSQQVFATVEAEAMPAHILRDMLRRAIEVLLPENALDVAKVAEESEREHIVRMANFLDGGAP
jgi:hypothetical protein